MWPRGSSESSSLELCHLRDAVRRLTRESTELRDVDDKFGVGFPVPFPCNMVAMGCMLFSRTWSFLW